MDRANFTICPLEYENGGALQTAVYAVKSGKTVIDLKDRAFRQLDL